MQSLADQIIDFVASELAVRPDRITLATTIFGDLHTDGDDGVEMLQAFGQKFNVDMSECVPNRYFGPEGFYPSAPLNWLRMAFRSGSPEHKAELLPITVADLVRYAEQGRWFDG